MTPIIGLLVVAIARALGVDVVVGKMLEGPYSRRVEKGEED